MQGHQSSLFINVKFTVNIEGVTNTVIPINSQSGSHHFFIAETGSVALISCSYCNPIHKPSRITSTISAYQVYCRIAGYSQDRAPITCIGIQTSSTCLSARQKANYEVHFVTCLRDIYWVTQQSHYKINATYCISSVSQIKLNSIFLQLHACRSLHPGRNTVVRTTAAMRLVAGSILLLIDVEEQQDSCLEPSSFISAVEWDLCLSHVRAVLEMAA